MSKISVAVVGTGGVGRTLAVGLASKGYPVVIGTRDVAKATAAGGALADLAKAHAGIKVLPTQDAVKASSLVILAVPGAAALDTVKALKPVLSGKIVMDASNPIGSGAPSGGVLPFFTAPNSSLMGALQEAVPEAKFVKGFNSVGQQLMVDPELASKPTMFICGNDAGAKAVVSELAASLGFEADDVGPVQCAGPIEALCQLWVARGINHGFEPCAFKLVKKAA